MAPDAPDAPSAPGTPAKPWRLSTARLTSPPDPSPLAHKPWSVRRSSRPLTTRA